MTAFLISVINLFFVPMISLAVHQHTVRKEKPSCKREIIMQYGIYTVLNFTAVKTVATVIRLISGFIFGAASGFYTLAGLFTGISLPLAAAVFFKFIHVTFEVKKYEKA